MRECVCARKLVWNREVFVKGPGSGRLKKGPKESEIEKERSRLSRCRASRDLTAELRRALRQPGDFIRPALSMKGGGGVQRQ